MTVPRALLAKVTNMSIVKHFDNENCRPQSISLYDRATVLPSAASHAEVKVHYRLKVKAIPLQAWTGPKGSKRLRLPHFKTVGT